MKDETPTTCRRCHRAVYASDVDDKGRCCFCQPDDEPKADATKPDAPKS